ncbi:MAG: SBBP repeat-containing protein [Bacteroidetes bacterium]|nr:SBBP repeat-containing protein [Bacteroidota bacterium]
MKTKLIIALIAICSFANAQSPAWTWAKFAGGTGDEIGKSVATDNHGNTYVTGYFTSSTITFGSTVLTCSGNKDVFVAKYDVVGNVLWAKKAGGPFDSS